MTEEKVMNNKDFPESKRLRQGAVLASIVHATMAPRYLELFHEYSWENTNHSIQDTMGCSGTIAFSKNIEGNFVAVFFDSNSPRNPFPSNVNYDVEQFFVNLPKHLFSLAYEEALQYELKEYRGTIRPIITTAFWCVDDCLAAAEPWQTVFENGGHLLEYYLLVPELALVEYSDSYEMTKQEYMLIKSLFERKMETPNAVITLTHLEKAILLEQAEPGGMENSRVAFKQIGIILP